MHLLYGSLAEETERRNEEGSLHAFLSHAIWTNRLTHYSYRSPLSLCRVLALNDRNCKFGCTFTKSLFRSSFALRISCIMRDSLRSTTTSISVALVPK